MEHLWIIEKASSKLLFYYSAKHSEIDGMLVSGMLSALNIFSESQLRANGIDNIEMGNLNWVYSNDEKLNLLLVTADSKKVNPNLMRSRLEVIKEIFVKTYGITPDYFDHGVIEITQFKTFEETITLLSDQWKRAGTTHEVGKIFDLLGIFQQVFLVLIKIIEKKIPDAKKSEIYQKLAELPRKLENSKEIDKMHESFRVISLFLPKVNTTKNCIDFDSETGQTLFSINPEGFDKNTLTTIFFIAFEHFKYVIYDEIGELVWIQQIKKRMWPLFTEYWDFLHEIKLLKKILILFYT